MHRALPHVPRVLLPHLRDARVILDHQIALVLPFDVENVLVLCRVRQRPLNQLARLWLGDPLEGLLR